MKNTPAANTFLIQRGQRCEHRNHERLSLIAAAINEQGHTHATVRSGVDKARCGDTNMLTDVRAQQIRDFPGFHDDLADLATDFFFFVRHVRVGSVCLTLHIHLIRQCTKRTFNTRLQISCILIEGTAQQDRNITRIRLEGIHVANEQEHLQHAHGKGVTGPRILGGTLNVVLHIRLEHCSDTVVEAIERRDRTQLLIRQILRDLLADTEQRTRSHR